MTKFLIVAAYAALMLFIGVNSIKKASTLTDFMVGGRKAGPIMSAFAYGTSYFSAVIFIGYAGRNGWDFGLFAILIGLSNAIFGTYLPWKFLAEPTRLVTKTYKIKTMPQYFMERYNSRFMKVFSAIIIFIFMVPYSASVYSGISYLSESVLNIDYTACMIFIGVLTAVYLVLGGYAGTLVADLVQGVIMLVGMAYMLLKITTTAPFGGFMESISASVANTVATVNLFDFSRGGNLLTLFCLCFLTSIGTWALPQTVHKFYAVRDKETIKSAASIATFFSLLIAVGTYFIGSLGPIFFGNVLPTLGGKVNFDMIVPIMLETMLPEILLALIFVLILSASMSTLSSLVLACASAISIDLLQNTFAKGMSNKQTLLVTRILCFVFIFLSVIIASFKTPILVLMSFAWGTVAGSFMGPFILGLFCKKITKMGAYAGMIGGFGLSLVLCVSSGFNASLAPVFGSLAMVVSVILTYTVSLFTKGFDNEHIDKFFNIKISVD